MTESDYLKLCLLRARVRQPVSTVIAEAVKRMLENNGQEETVR